MLRADAIVVLGCRILPSGRLSAPAARRAATAASAFQVGIGSWIVASGGRRWGSQIEARALRREMARAGVPEGAVIEELCSLTTYENAVFSASVLRSLGARRAAIVTCPWHMTRALENFRAAGVDACPLPTGRAPASLPGRAYLRAHEVICGRLDALAMRRLRLLPDHAATLLGRARSAPGEAPIAAPVREAAEGP